MLFPMETIVFDDGSMRHSVSQCHCVSPVPTAVLGWCRWPGGSWVGQGKEKGFVSSTALEGDWEVTGPAKVTLFPPQPRAVWTEPHVCLLSPTPCWGAHRLV